MAEAAVAEQIETTPAPSPDEVVTTPEGDAEPSTPADAGTTPEPVIDLSQIEAEADAWLAEQSQKEGETKAPEPVQPQRVDPALVERERADLRREYDAQMKELDTLESELIEAGVDSLAARRIVKERKDRFNNYHATALNKAGYESAVMEARNVALGLQQAVPKPVYESLVEKAQKGNFDYKDMFADVWAAGKAEGEAAGKKAGMKEGFVAGRSHAEKVAKGASSGQQVEGTQPTGNLNYTVAQLRDMDPSEYEKIPIEVRRAVYAAGR